MTDESVRAIRDADLRSLAAKLKGLHALLTPPEQVILRAVLRRAAQRDGTKLSDAEGLVWGVKFNPFTFLDAIDLDFRPERDAHDRCTVHKHQGARTETSAAPPFGGHEPPERKEREP